jgi:hypothetical protein
MDIKQLNMKIGLLLIEGIRTNKTNNQQEQINELKTLIKTKRWD